MRKRNKTPQLGRKKGHREAMLANLSAALLLNKRIFTTKAKAKALQRFIEPLITKSKHDTVHSRRQVFAKVRDKKAVRELFDAISKKVADRPGGYTRILKTGFRQHDGADKCLIELVDYNENMLKTKKKKKKKTRRGSSGSGGSSKRGSRGKGKKKKSKRGSRGKGKKKKSSKKSGKKSKSKKSSDKQKKSKKKSSGKKKGTSNKKKSKNQNKNKKNDDDKKS